MSLVINYKKNLQVTTLLNKLEKLIKMRDIVDSKFIVAHQEEILKTGDIISSIKKTKPKPTTQNTIKCFQTNSKQLKIG